MLKSTPKVRKRPRSGLNLEGRLSNPQVFFSLPAASPDGEGSDDGQTLAEANSEGCLAASENSVINIFIEDTPVDFVYGKLRRLLTRNSDDGHAKAEAKIWGI